MAEEKLERRFSYVFFKTTILTFDVNFQSAGARTRATKLYLEFKIRHGNHYTTTVPIA